MIESFLLVTAMIALSLLSIFAWRSKIYKRSKLQEFPVVISDQTKCSNLDKLKELIKIYVGIKRNIIISDPKFTYNNAVRAEIHEYCRTLNITSETSGVGDSPDKIIMITLKLPKQSKIGLTERELSVFVRLAKLPIDHKLLCDEDLFLDRLYALDEFYLEQEAKKSGPNHSPKKMFQAFLDLKKKHGNKLIAYLEEVRRIAISSMTSTDEYKRITRDKQEKRDNTKATLTNVINPYQIRSDDYWGISLDIKKANYNVIRKFHPEIIGNTDTWAKFISQFTDSEFLINSKIFRQEIMGKTTNKRITALQRQVVSEIISFLEKNCISINGPISNDEIIISSTKKDVVALAKRIKSLIDQTNYGDIWRIDVFCVRPIMLIQKRKFSPFIRRIMIDYNGSIDDDDNFVVDFRHVPKMYWFQIMKYYCGKPINNYDLTMSDDYGNLYVLPYPIVI